MVSNLPYLAEIELPDDCPIRHRQTGSNPGHYTIWGKPEKLLGYVRYVERVRISWENERMDKWYELWNSESGNLVASYDSLASAMQNLSDTAAIRPPSWFEGKELIAEYADESDPDVVAEDQALYSLARSVSGTVATG